MSAETDCETWLIETGDGIIEKKASFGVSALSSLERLIYCLWVADYGMRNAGDLETAFDLYPTFQAEGLEMAKQLSLPNSLALFDLPREEMEAKYFAHFSDVCAEIAKLTNQRSFS